MELKIRKFWIVCVLLGLMVESGTIGAVLATSSSQTLWISAGVYPGAPSYTVWAEGSNYFAKDSNGQIDYAGTNSTTIVQNAIDIINATKSGGTILLKEGTYGEDGVRIHLHDGIHLIGEGSVFSPYGEGSVWGENALIPVTRFRGIIDLIGVRGAEVRDIGIVPSTNRNAEGEAGIFIQSGHYNKIERVSIARYNTGIMITTFNEITAYSSVNQILYPLIFNCTYGIILTHDGAGNKAEVTQIYGGGIYGLSASEQTTVGIQLINSDFTSINGVMLVNCVTGVQVASGSNEDTHISSLTFESVTTPYDIATALTNFSVYPTVPYFENYGQVSTNSSGAWVAHGMLGIPDYIFVTVDADVNVFYNSANVTYIHVVVESGTHAVNWHTIYIP